MYSTMPKNGQLRSVKLRKWSYISQRSVATSLKCGGTFHNHLLQFHSECHGVQEFGKSFHIWRSYSRQLQYSGTFVTHWHSGQGALMGGHICPTWRIRLNPPSVAATRPYVKLLWPLVELLVNQTASRSVQPFLHSSVLRQRDYATRSVTIGHIYIRSTA